MGRAGGSSKRGASSGRTTPPGTRASSRLSAASGTSRGRPFPSSSRGGYPAPSASAGVAPGGGLVGRAAREGRACWTADILTDPELVVTEELRRNVGSRVRAVLAAPVRIKDGTLGVLSISDSRVREFAPTEVALLQSFADQAALALENARLHEGLEQRAKRLRTLSSLSQLISSSLDLGHVLEEITRAAAAFVGVPTVHFWVADEAAETLTLTAASNEELVADLPRRTLAYAAGALGW